MTQTQSNGTCVIQTCLTSWVHPRGLQGWITTQTRAQIRRERPFPPQKYLKEMAGTTGLEPATSAVTGQRSNQLNYVPSFRRASGKPACLLHFPVVNCFACFNAFHPRERKPGRNDSMRNRHPEHLSLLCA